jgi:hypothetical protein
MAFSAIQSTVNNAGRDQFNYYFINYGSPVQIPGLIDHGPSRHGTLPLGTVPRENAVVTSHHTHQTVSIIDLSINRIGQIVELLSDDIGNLSRCRDLKTELEFIDQTLFLTKSATQVFKHTPLDRNITNTVSPEAEQCSIVLCDIFDKISCCRQRPQSTMIDFFWFTVCWNWWDKEELRQLILKLSDHRKNLDGFLIELNS